MSVEEIATQLGLSKAGVKYYNQETYNKLGVNNKAAAVAEARNFSYRVDIWCSPGYRSGYLIFKKKYAHYHTRVKVFHRVYFVAINEWINYNKK